VPRRKPKSLAGLLASLQLVSDHGKVMVPGARERAGQVRYCSLVKRTIARSKFEEQWMRRYAHLVYFAVQEVKF
jgi:hypothetical protein